VLWIDFICINQSDVLEKNHQVKRMGEIYSNASRVVAWLGEADSSSGPLFTALNQPDFPHRSADREGKLGYIRFWAENLSGLDYWTRLWIIQELGLTPDIFVVCGSRSVGWELLHPWCWQSYAQAQHSQRKQKNWTLSPCSASKRLR
jgi:hypothetical protein